MRPLPTILLAVPARAARLTAAAMIAAPLLAPLPAAAGRGMTLGPVGSATLPGCDNPTPVWTTGAVYSNVSDCSVGSGGKISTGWVRLWPWTEQGLVPSTVTARGDGPAGSSSRAPSSRAARSTCWSATSRARAGCGSAGAPASRGRA